MSACARFNRIRQPPENWRDRIQRARRGKPEARQERRRAGARGVAADLVEAVMQERERFAVTVGIARRRGFGRGEIALDVAQLAVAVQDELDRRRRDRGRLPASRGRSSTPVGGSCLPRPGGKLAADQARTGSTCRTRSGPMRPALCPAWTVRFAPSSRRFAPRARRGS
jgi:hypothetical protein